MLAEDVDPIAFQQRPGKSEAKPPSPGLQRAKELRFKKGSGTDTFRA